jgi:hypothetical protein
MYRRVTRKEERLEGIKIRKKQFCVEFQLTVCSGYGVIKFFIKLCGLNFSRMVINSLQGTESVRS